MMIQCPKRHPFYEVTLDMDENQNLFLAATSIEDKGVVTNGWGTSGSAVSTTVRASDKIEFGSSARAVPTTVCGLKWTSWLFTRSLCKRKKPKSAS